MYYQSLIAGYLRRADIIEEVDENLTYIGFCKTGTLTTDQDTWKILKVEKSDLVTTLKWADGSQQFHFSWDLRATYDYYWNL